MKPIKFTCLILGIMFLTFSFYTDFYKVFSITLGSLLGSLALLAHIIEES